MEEEQVVLRVNKYDILSVLLQFVTNLFGVTAGLFQMFSQLARAHSAYVDEMHEFHADVAYDIEMLGGE